MTVAVVIAAAIVFFASPVIVAGILLFPFAFVAIKRNKMLAHLYKTADLCGYRVRPLHKLVFLSHNRDDRYDILIENDTHAYVIKLWSAKRSDSTLVINKNGTYYEGTVVPSGLSKEEKFVVTGKPKAVPVTRENYRVKKTKKLEKILLYYPENEKVQIDLGDRRVPLVEGQRIFGKTVLTPKTFEKMLRGARPAANTATAVVSKAE